MRWLVADSLTRPEQFFCSHLDSYSHYLREAGDKVTQVCFDPFPVGSGDFTGYPDVAFMLDLYSAIITYPAEVKKIAQVAAICDPMPWDVRNPDGSPAYDLVISSIPWMVEEARSKGCRAEYMPLAFDTRARVCGMGVKRDIDCLFVGTRGPNHRKREEILSQLGDLVTIAPPTFGREYFKLLARAETVINVHAEWSKGSANNMRLYEAPGMGAAVVSDGLGTTEMGQRWWSKLGGDPNAESIRAGYSESIILTMHTYESRIPRLIELARSL